MTFLNHYSYALAVLVLLAWLGSEAYRRRTPRSLVVLAIAAALSIGFNLALRANSPDLSASDFQSALADGRPTLVAFVSDY